MFMVKSVFVQQSSPYMDENQAVVFPADTRTLSTGNIKTSQEIPTKQGTRRTSY